MRQENLTVIKGGLNRQRTKGAAPKDSLYDLLNGYVTTEKTVKVRPGTLLEETLTAGTFGLVHFDSKFHVFASSTVSVPSGYTLHLLQAPTGNALSRIHFAEPFLGFLYVVAEFDTDEIYHYWLRTAADWEANKVYKANQLAEPTTADGFLYKATRLGDPYPVWTSGAPRAVSDIVEPTEYNGLYFQVVSAFGTNPISGSTEPDWADAEPGQIFIDTPDDTPTQTPPTPNVFPDDDVVPDEVRDRYDDRRQGTEDR
jgi:hypothetical protein